MVSFQSRTPGVPAFSASLPQRPSQKNAPQPQTFGTSFSGPSARIAPRLLLLAMLLLSPLLGRGAKAQEANALSAEAYRNVIVETVPHALADDVFDSAELQSTINNPDTPEEQREPLRKMDHFVRNTPGHTTLTVADLEALEAAGEGKITADVVDNLPEILGWPEPPCLLYIPIAAGGGADLSMDGFIKTLVWANNEAMVDDRIDSAELQAALNHPDTMEAFIEPLGKLDWHLNNNGDAPEAYTRGDLEALEAAGNGKITAEVADRAPEILNW